ncbi:MAG: hypothetical protein KDN22_18455, partial [Verrucomicrobiae bacterium]|nr:hypothetical protein [Verrucomicrobiae bacterium]
MISKYRGLAINVVALATTACGTSVAQEVHDVGLKELLRKCNESEEVVLPSDIRGRSNVSLCRYLQEDAHPSRDPEARIKAFEASSDDGVDSVQGWAVGMM